MTFNFFLGDDDPGLASLRQFRNEILNKSEKDIEAFSTEILEKMIERLKTTLDSEEKPLIDEIAVDIEILIDELVR